MIDHVMDFPDEASAFAALGPLGFATQDASRVWQWDTSRVIPGQAIVKTEAVWDNKDPKNPVLVSPEVKEAGFWVLVSLVAGSPALKAMASLSQVRDRDKANLGQSYVSDDKGVVGASRLAPVFAGSKY